MNRLAFLPLLPLLSVLTLAGCASPTDAVDNATAEVHTASDLATDLAQPAGWLGTPFVGQDDRPVASELAASLTVLVDRCIAYRETRTTLLPTVNLCPAELEHVVRDDRKVTERATVLVGGARYTAVIWDNEDSDGGDVQDLALYAADGDRVGVYRTVYARNDTVLDVLKGVFSKAVEVP